MRRSPRLDRMLTAVICAATVLIGPGSASAASAGDTILTSGVPLPAGAFPSSGSGNEGAEGPGTPSMSGDGRFVAFLSGEDNLAPGVNRDTTNVFRKDRTTGAVELISRTTGSGGAGLAAAVSRPVISEDGNRVAWLSDGAFVPADVDGKNDVYVRDVAAGTTTLATPGTTTAVSGYDLSGNGEWIAFATDDALAGADDANGESDIYRRNLATGAVTLGSVVNASTAAGAGASTEPAISDDGAWVAFTSSAKNLFATYVSGGAAADVFAHRFSQNLTVLISAKYDSLITTGGNGRSFGPVIAGQPAAGATLRVGFTSTATNLADDAVTDPSSDLSAYVRRFSQGESTLVSRADGANGANADSAAGLVGISDDAQRVVFFSQATNLTAVPSSRNFGAFARSVAAGTTTRLSTTAGQGLFPAISADGAFVTWLESGATADADPFLRGVFGRPFPSGAIELVSRPAGSAPLVSAAPEVVPANPGARTVSGDGRYVVFTARGAGLGSGAEHQVYRRDLRTNALDLVSRASGADGAVANAFVSSPSIDASGMRVAFITEAALDPADTNGQVDIYVRDLQANTTTLASRSMGASGAVGDDGSDTPALSADGKRVAFRSAATNFGINPGGATHIYVRDLFAATTTAADRANGAAGAVANKESSAPQLSGDGRLVVFQTGATNLSPDDATPGTEDIYLRDLEAATTTLLSRRNGLTGAKVAGSAGSPAFSSDGSTVAFTTSDEVAAPEAGPWGGLSQVVARKVSTGKNAAVSRSAGDGAIGNQHAGTPSVSADGGVVAFASAATNLLAGVGGGQRSAVFARNLATGALSGPPAFGLAADFADQRAFAPSVSEDGQCMAFAAQGHNAITGQAGDIQSAYLYVVSGSCPKPEPAAPAPTVTPAATPPVALSTVAPTLSKASLTNKRFKAGPGSTPLTAAATRAAAPKRKTPVGTTFAFTLNTTATVQITITRQVNGRKVGKQCVKATPKLRKRSPCKRAETVGKLTRTAVPAGVQKVAFSGRLGNKKLPVGAYRAVLSASGPGGTSKPVTLPFTVVAR